MAMKRTEVETTYDLGYTEIQMVGAKHVLGLYGIGNDNGGVR